MEIAYLTPDNAVFEETQGRMLSIRTEGKEHPVVYLHSSFPHTNRSIFVSVRTIDNEEVGMIRSVDDFPQATAELLRKHIEFRYFAPMITGIMDIKEEFGYSFWDTETTAGRCRFTVGRGHNVRVVADEKVLITDVDGNRFVIPNLRELSDKEYRLVEMYI